MTGGELAALARRRATELGFEACGITDLAPSAERAALDDWLSRGYHGEMKYMERQAAVRREPARAWPQAKSVVVVLHSYYQDQPMVHGEYRVARYAQGIDYHSVIGDKLDRLGQVLVAAAGRGSYRAYVDAGPLPERELARRAGLGWVAKNTMLIHPGLGSFTFIGCLLTDLELPADAPFDVERCGSCTRCLEACPTAAFPVAGVLDATRCVSYLTIEAKSDVPESLRERVGDNLFGCDICQDVCPWNEKFASPTREIAYRPRPDAEWPSLREIMQMDERVFEARFSATALERARLEGLKRNARVVLENRPR
ncbi:MAG: tRNA epoxyqueuosine(34) reductase QueG [Gemmatimonadales bacterium]